jgi:hypothetical protein
MKGSEDARAGHPRRYTGPCLVGTVAITITADLLDVSSWHKADMAPGVSDVRFWVKSRHRYFS